MGPFDNWFLSLFLDDPDLNFRVHLRVELNWDVVDSEGSDRFIELYWLLTANSSKTYFLKCLICIIKY